MQLASKQRPKSSPGTVSRQCDDLRSKICSLAYLHFVVLPNDPVETDACCYSHVQCLSSFFALAGLIRIVYPCLSTAESSYPPWSIMKLPWNIMKLPWNCHEIAMKLRWLQGTNSQTKLPAFPDILTLSESTRDAATASHDQASAFQVTHIGWNGWKYDVLGPMIPVYRSHVRKLGLSDSKKLCFCYFLGIKHGSGKSLKAWWGLSAASRFPDSGALGFWNRGLVLSELAAPTGRDPDGPCDHVAEMVLGNTRSVNLCKMSCEYLWMSISVSISISPKNNVSKHMYVCRQCVCIVRYMSAAMYANMYGS